MGLDDAGILARMNVKTYLPTGPQTVAVLGLGVMGYPMAGHLARAGHRVSVYNRSAGKAQAWAAELNTASPLAGSGLAGLAAAGAAAGAAA